MKTFFLFVVSFLIILSCRGQYTGITLNSQSVSKDISKIAVDGSGNTVVSGNFGTTITFGSFTLTSNTPSAPYTVSLAAFVAKMDTNSNFLWAKAINPVAVPANSGQSYVQIKGLSSDAFGNTYLTGYFTGKVSFDNIILTSTKNGSAYTRDMFTSKISAAGSVIWAKAEGTANDGCNAYEFGASVAADNLGNVYATGELVHKVFKNTTACAPICSTATSKSVTCVYIVKYSSTGTKVLEKKFFNSQATAASACSKNCQGTNLKIDASGDVYVAGEIAGSVAFGNVVLNTGSETVRNSFLLKMNGTGQTIWVKSITNMENITYWLGEGQCFIDDNSSAVYISGLTYGAGAASLGNCSLTTNATGGYLAKYSTLTGDCSWVEKTGGIVYGLAKHPQGDMAMLLRTDVNGQPSIFAIKTVLKTDGSTIDSTSFVPGALWSGLAETADGFAFCQSLSGSYNIGGSTISSAVGQNSLMVVKYTEPPTQNLRLGGSQSSDIFLYPNPATDQITIRSGRNEILGKITICDLAGRKVAEQNVLSSETSFIVKDLSPGVYYLRSDKASPVKFIIQ
jgi:hypothetical protein